MATRYGCPSSIQNSVAQDYKCPTYYKGLKGKQAWCPNCGRVEIAAHLCLCPSEGRTKLFLESTEDVQSWLLRDGNTERELVYCIPKYGGIKNMAEMGCMSPQMANLAQSQDVVGWKNFTQRRISTHLFDIQNEHLILGNHRINTKQWIKQFISKILHILHSQWIFRNFTLHDKQKGWLRRKELHEVMRKIYQLRETNIDNIPESSRFLLEMDCENLM